MNEPRSSAAALLLGLPTHEDLVEVFRRALRPRAALLIAEHDRLAEEIRPALFEAIKAERYGEQSQKKAAAARKLAAAWPWSERVAEVLMAWGQLRPSLQKRPASAGTLTAIAKRTGLTGRQVKRVMDDIQLAKKVKALPEKMSENSRPSS